MYWYSQSVWLQLKARAVTAWRHSGEHGNELSVFCWWEWWTVSRGSWQLSRAWSPVIGFRMLSRQRRNTEADTKSCPSRSPWPGAARWCGGRRRGRRKRRNRDEEDGADFLSNLWNRMSGRSRHFSTRFSYRAEKRIFFFVFNGRNKKNERWKKQPAGRKRVKGRRAKEEGTSRRPARRLRIDSVWRPKKRDDEEIVYT